MNNLMTEFTRNLSGYLLLLASVTLIVVGSHGNASLEQTGQSLLAAALLAMSVKRPAAENPADRPGDKPPST